jgi:hypothetical protein
MEVEPFATDRRFVRAPGWPEGSEEGWRCEIRCETHDAGSRFRAVALPPSGDEPWAIGEAEGSRWLPPADGDGPTPEHDAAIAGLESALLQAGWDRAGRGDQWYAERFVWRREGEPPSRLEPVLAEAEDPS